jgi:hypothetical protein
MSAVARDTDMKILNGWKEIADCLHLTSRSAQRWERLGLPVRRVSDSTRSPIIAFSDEIEEWARMKKKKLDGCGSLNATTTAYKATRCETQKLVGELREARKEHRRLLDAIHAQIAASRALAANNPWTFPHEAPLNTCAAD